MRRTSLIQHNINLRFFAYGLSLMCLSTVVNLSYAQISDAELLDALEDKDRVHLSPPSEDRLIASYTEYCKADPLFRGQGMVTKHCRASWTENTRAIKIVSSYEKKPVFIARQGNSRGGWYDADGNCIVWRSQERLALSTKKRNELLDLQVMYRIDAQGTIVEELPWTMLYRYPVGDSENLYQLSQFLLAVGRGFTPHLHGLDLRTLLPVGLEKIVGPGSYGHGLAGEWQISVDSGSELLVRNAIFMIPGKRTPSIRTTSSGIIKSAGFSVGSEGVFDYGADEKTFVVKAFSRVDSSAPDLVSEQVTARLDSPLPPGESEIIDYQGGRPGVTTKILE